MANGKKTKQQKKKPQNATEESTVPKDSGAQAAKVKGVRKQRLETTRKQKKEELVHARRVERIVDVADIRADDSGNYKDEDLDALMDDEFIREVLAAEPGPDPMVEGGGESKDVKMTDGYKATAPRHAMKDESAKEAVKSRGLDKRRERVRAKQFMDRVNAFDPFAKSKLTPQERSFFSKEADLVRRIHELNKANALVSDKASKQLAVEAMKFLQPGGPYDSYMEHAKSAFQNDPDSEKGAYEYLLAHATPLFSHLEKFRASALLVTNKLRDEGKLSVQELDKRTANLNQINGALQNFSVHHHKHVERLTGLPSTAEVEREGKAAFTDARDPPSLPDGSDEELENDPLDADDLLDGADLKFPNEFDYVPQYHNSLDDLMESFQKLHVDPEKAGVEDPEVEGLIAKMQDLDPQLQETPSSEGFASEVGSANVATQQQGAAIDEKDVAAVQEMSLPDVKRRVKALHNIYDLIIPQFTTPEAKKQQKEAVKSVESGRQYLLGLLQAIRNFMRPPAAAAAPAPAHASTERMEAVLARLTQVLEKQQPAAAAPVPQGSASDAAAQAEAAAAPAPAAPAPAAPAPAPAAPAPAPASTGGIGALSLGGNEHETDDNELRRRLRSLRPEGEETAAAESSLASKVDRRTTLGRNSAFTRHGGGGSAVSMGRRGTRPSAVDVRGRLTYANSGMAAFQRLPIPVHEVPFKAPPSFETVRDPEPVPNVPAPALGAMPVNPYAAPVARIRT